jgi:shikimate dehydrogenase
MLLHQAARQLELYTGRAAPLAAMDEALQRAIG